MIVSFNQENFKKQILEADRPVLVDFYAEWCPPCRVLSPILEEIMEKYQDKIKIAKLNIDEGRALALEYNIMSVPTLIIFRNGKEIKRIVGLLAKEELEKVLDSL